MSVLCLCVCVFCYTKAFCLQPSYKAHTLCCNVDVVPIQQSHRSENTNTIFPPHRGFSWVALQLLNSHCVDLGKTANKQQHVILFDIIKEVYVYPSVPFNIDEAPWKVGFNYFTYNININKIHGNHTPPCLPLKKFNKK